MTRPPQLVHRASRYLDPQAKHQLPPLHQARRLPANLPGEAAGAALNQDLAVAQTTIRSLSMMRPPQLVHRASRYLNQQPKHQPPRALHLRNLHQHLQPLLLKKVVKVAPAPGRGRGQGLNQKPSTTQPRRQRTNPNLQDVSSVHPRRDTVQQDHIINSYYLPSINGPAFIMNTVVSSFIFIKNN